jgi:AAA domain
MASAYGRPVDLLPDKPVILASPEPLIQAPSILLMGETGAGKTYSIRTLLDAGLETFVIGTEPTFLDTLLDASSVRGQIRPGLHWKAVQPARVGIAGIQEMVKKISTMDFKGLADAKPDNQRQHAQLVTLLSTLANFVDDRTGKEFGSVESWGADRALVIDSLSGLNLMAMDLTIGNKVTAHMGEWGVAMGTLEKLLLNLCSNLKCFFVLTSHLEREADDNTGGSKLMVSTLGKKLAPKIPRFFSEVVLAYREGEAFHWSTALTGVVLKHRALPLGAKLLPSFEPIVAAHKRRLASLTGVTPQARQTQE